MPYLSVKDGNACRRRWWARNRERMNAWCRQYRNQPKVKAQRAAYQKQRRKDHPDFYRDQSFRKKYGITLADYDRMFQEQNGRCAICQDRPKSARAHHRLQVDHSHEKNVVRGLLCSRCNVAAGYLEHLNRKIREPAEAYLRLHA